MLAIARPAVFHFWKPYQCWLERSHEHRKKAWGSHGDNTMTVDPPFPCCQRGLRLALQSLSCEAMPLWPLCHFADGPSRHRSLIGTNV